MNPQPVRKRQIIIVLAVILGLAVVMVFFAGVTRGVMVSLRESLLADFTRQTGYAVSYDSISPSFFRFLEIRNLSINSLDGEQRTVARVETLRVHYRIFDLFFLADKLNAVEGIEADRARLSIDAVKDAPLIGLLEGLLKDPGQEHVLSPNFTLTGGNCQVTVTDNASFWSLKDLFVTASNSGTALSFSLHSRGEAGPADRPGDPEYTTGLDINGSVDRSFSRVNAELAVESLKAGDVILKDQQFLFNLKDNTADITKVQDRSPVDLSLSYNIERRELTADVLAQDLRPEDLIEFSDNLASLRPALAGSVTADGRLRYLADDNDLDFTLALSARLPESVSTAAFGVDARVTGTEERAVFSPIKVTSSLGNVEFNGNVVFSTLFPEGYLRFTNVKTSVTEDINADLSIARDEYGVKVTGDRILIGSTGFRTFILDIFPKAGRASFAVTAALDLPVPDHRLNVSGVLDYHHGVSLSLNGDLSLLPANIIYRAVTAAPDFAPAVDRTLAGIMLSSRCRFTTDFASFSFSSPDMSLVDRENPANRIRFDVSADQAGLTLADCRGVWADYRLEGNLALTQRDAATLEFSTGFSVNGEPYLLNGRSVAGSGLMVSGTHDFDLMLVPRDTGGYMFTVQASALPVPVGDATLLATLDWIGAVSPRGGVELVSRRTLVSGLPALLPGMKNASADLRFSLQNEHLLVSRIRVRDAVSDLQGNGAFDVAVAPEPRLDGWLYLSDEQEFENYQALVSLGPERNRIDLTFANSPLARLGDLPVRGGVSGTVVVHGPWNDPSADFNLALARGRINSESVKLASRFSLSRSGINVSSLEGAYGSAVTLEGGRGGVSFDDGRLDVSLRITTGAEKPVTSDITFEADMTVSNADEAVASLFDTEFAGALNVADRSNGKNWDVNFSMSNGEFSLLGGPHASWRGLVRRDGYFVFDLAPPFPLQGHFEGSVTNGVVDARAETVVLLLPDLNMLINSPYFVIRDGVARGDFTVTGPIGDPDFFGVLAVERLAASSRVFADPIEPFDTVLEARAKTLRFRDIRTKTGACPLDLQAEMIVDHWNVARFAARLKVDDPTGVHVSLPVDIFSFDGFVTTPGLTLAIDPAGVSISGDLYVQDCDVVLGQTAKAPESEQAAAANLVADLSLKTGRKVELYWPARELPILRMLPEPGAALTVAYNKLKNEFALNGDVKFKGGNVYYFERNFIIREGSLSLKETQLDFNPVLNLKAERKVRYQDRDVNISLIVPNQHLKDFAPVFESDPPLPITERYLALGGIIQSPGENQSEEYFSSIVSDIGGDVLTQLVLLRPLEDKVKDLLNLDGFSIRTPLIKNLLADTLFSTDATSTANSPINMGRYLNNTEISFQKYLDDNSNLFFETIVRFQSDAAATADGGSTGQMFGNVNVESEFSLELTTPFFLTIKWSITPEHWESFFLPDNKISFKWGISF